MLQHLLDPNPPAATDAHRDAVRRRAAALKRRRRSAVAAGVCVVAVSCGAAVAALSEDTTTTRTIEPANPTTTTAVEPLLPDDAPLFDGPIPTVPRTTVLVDGPITLSFASSPEQGVGVRFQYGDDPGGASFSAEPQHLLAISNGGVGEHESRGNWAYRFGVTRADIVSITLVPAEGSPRTVATVAHPAAPSVRFFVVEDPGLPDPEDPTAFIAQSELYGYDSAGRLVSANRA